MAWRTAQTCHTLGFLYGGKRMAKAFRLLQPWLLFHQRGRHSQWRGPISRQCCGVLSILTLSSWNQKNLVGRWTQTTNHWVRSVYQTTQNLPQTTFWKWSDVAAKVNPPVTPRDAVVRIKAYLAQCFVHVSRWDVLDHSCRWTSHHASFRLSAFFNLSIWQHVSGLTSPSRILAVI